MTTPKFDDDHPFYRPSHFVFGPHQKFKPLFNTPLTRWSDHWFSYSDTKCARYESLFLKCAYQGSRRMIETRCVKELEDLEECLFRPKEKLRMSVMRKERSRQGKWEENPLPDIYWERHAR